MHRTTFFTRLWLNVLAAKAARGLGGKGCARYSLHSIVYCIYTLYIYIYAQNYTDTLTHTHTQIYIYRQNVRAYCILAMFVFHTSSVNAVSLHFKETQNSYKDTVYPF